MVGLSVCGSSERVLYAYMPGEILANLLFSSFFAFLNTHTQKPFLLPLSLAKGLISLYNDNLMVLAESLAAIGSGARGF